MAASWFPVAAAAVRLPGPDRPPTRPPAAPAACSTVPAPALGQPVSGSTSRNSSSTPTLRESIVRGCPQIRAPCGTPAGGGCPPGPLLARAPGEHGGHEVAPAAHAELVESRGQVLLDGVGRDVQFVDDLPGGMPPDDQRDHPGLGSGESIRAEQQRTELRRGGGLDD